MLLFVSILICSICSGVETSGPVLPDGPVPVNSASDAYQELERELLQIWKSDRQEAVDRLVSFSATPETSAADRAAAEVRLGYMYSSLDQRWLAKARFASAAATPFGINDWARGVAAFRLLYLEKGRTATKLADQIIRGEFRVGRGNYLKTLILAANTYHSEKDYEPAISLYGFVAAHGDSSEQKARANCELAGMWIELANGCGIAPLELSERPNAFDTARSHCTAVLAERAALTTTTVMLAEMMYLETYQMQGRFEESFVHSQAFMNRWGNQNQSSLTATDRKYVNNSRVFHVINSYVTGRFENLSVTLETMIQNPPVAGEQFGRQDAYAYAVVISRLIADEREDQEALTRLLPLIEKHNTSYMQNLEVNLVKKREQYLKAR